MYVEMSKPKRYANKVRITIQYVCKLCPYMYMYINIHENSYA